MTEPSDFDPDERADELASAIVDGEATDEELAQAEADPAIAAELADRIEAFTHVAATVATPVTPPPASVKAAHIGAAMAAFDDIDLTSDAPATVDPAATDAATSAAASRGLAAVPTGRAESNETEPDTPSTGPVDEPVIDLRAERIARTERKNRWLTSAAAAVLVIGGIGFVGYQLGNSESADTASVEFDDASDDAESAEDAGAVSASGADAPAEAFETEAMEDDETAADADDAMEEEAMEDEDMEEGEAAMDDAGDEASSDTTPTTTTTPSADPDVARSAVIAPTPFADVDLDELVSQSEAVEPLAIDESFCAPQIGVVDGVWFPVESPDGEFGELIIERASDGEEVPRLVNSDCAVIQ